jgi:hypothetical protein
MHTISGLLYLHQRMGALGTPVLLLLALAVVIVTGLALTTVTELLAAGSDPIQVAPLRWHRYRV